MGKYRKIACVLIVTAIALLTILGFLLYPYINAGINEYGLAGIKRYEVTDETITSVTGEENGENPAKSEIFDEELYDRKVIVSGEPVGIYMKTQGVLVVDICSFKNMQGMECCPAKGKLIAGDYITAVNGTAVTKRSQLLGLVAQSCGSELGITYVRDGEEGTCIIVPEKNISGTYLMGAWVKDDVSGIGTVTFVDGQNFMALGHGVSDVDTGLIMSCSTGGVYSTSITSISKSYCYEPGRLLGNISYSEDLTGIIYGNSDSGIYGRFAADYVEEKYGDETSMYIARGREVKKGTAYIYSRLLGELRKYEIEIEQVDRWSGDKNVEFHVVDEELLTLTGGVVQGMSGSPIVQDGKLIGAVTHVFVDDPTRGYGIFIEEMVKE